MILCPTAQNLLSKYGTLSTGAAAFGLGKPGTNLVTTDPMAVAEWRGTFTVVLNVNDDLPFTGTGARTPVLTPGTYHGPAAFAAHVESIMNGAGDSTAYQVSFSQATTGGFYRFHVYNGSQTFSIDGATTPTTSAWVLLMGFTATDTATGAENVGDFVASSGANLALYDLGAAYAADVGIVANLSASPGGVVSVQVGSTSAVSDDEFIAGDHLDGSCTLLVYNADVRHRYVQFTVTDPRREDALRTSAGYLYHGPAFRSDISDDEAEWINFDRGGLTRERSGRSLVSTGQSGRVSLAEAQPGEVVSLPFGGSGVGGQIAEVEAIVTMLGSQGRAFLCSDPDTEPHRESALVRLASMPTYQRTGAGRSTTSLSFEIERMM